jgi:shikimate kinase
LFRGVVLVGFMGAGKSAVGRAVSRLTGAPFVDLDDRIEADAGATISEIFREAGEAAFRELERRAIREVVTVPGRILATGGGAFVDPGNRAMLKRYAPVIHLAVEPETVLLRLGKDNRRPLLRGGERERKIRELMALRRDAYEEADITIPTDRKSVQEIASLVVSAATSPGGRGPS